MRDGQRGYFYTTPGALLEAVASVAESHPATRLVKNSAGNLAIVDVDADRVLGYVDVYDAVVVWHDRPRPRA